MDQYEGPGEIQLDNRTLAESTSISVSGTGNNNPVRTMKKGLAGRSRGPVEFNITIENAIPKAGLEQEFIRKVVENADVVISHIVADKTYLYDGWVDTVDVSQSTDSPATISFTVMAGPPRII